MDMQITVHAPELADAITKLAAAIADLRPAAEAPAAAAEPDPAAEPAKPKPKPKTKAVRAAAPADEPPSAPAEPPAAAAAAAPAVTVDDVLTRVTELITAGKKAAAREIVTAYAPSVSAIPADKCAEVLARLDALEV